eukprot:TRINITY_DN485_c0_g1_i1.p1 TRINITY_DN485_c0_g1~~TRINITY_DN485_c0_g1_i1.p1  ORF type:complete len:397 (-),score=-9.94 TRINITY_DN485_c0_g1_i1:244-1434(-)
MEEDKESPLSSDGPCITPDIEVPVPLLCSSRWHPLNTVPPTSPRSSRRLMIPIAESVDEPNHPYRMANMTKKFLLKRNTRSSSEGRNLCEVLDRPKKNYVAWTSHHKMDTKKSRGDSSGSLTTVSEFSSKTLLHSPQTCNLKRRKSRGRRVRKSSLDSSSGDNQSYVPRVVRSRPDLEMANPSIEQLDMRKNVRPESPPKPAKVVSKGGGQLSSIMLYFNPYGSLSHQFALYPLSLASTSYSSLSHAPYIGPTPVPHLPAYPPVLTDPALALATPLPVYATPTAFASVAQPTHARVDAIPATAKKTPTPVNISPANISPATIAITPPTPAVPATITTDLHVQSDPIPRHSSSLKQERPPLHTQSAPQLLEKNEGPELPRVFQFVQEDPYSEFFAFR